MARLFSAFLAALVIASVSPVGLMLSECVANAATTSSPTKKASVAAASRKRPKTAGRRNRRPLFRKAPDTVPNQRGRVVIFPFRNDEGDDLSRQIAQLLESRGLDVVTGVRPVDTAEQFRDMATHLHVAAYVDGDLRGSDTRARATVRLRSGYTGRRVAQVVFTDTRDNLPKELSDKLWTKLGRPMARVCADASKPRKRSRTLRINAGTPIDSGPTASQ